MFSITRTQSSPPRIRQNTSWSGWNVLKNDWSYNVYTCIVIVLIPRNICILQWFWCMFCIYCWEAHALHTEINIFTVENDFHVLFYSPTRLIRSTDLTDHLYRCVHGKSLWSTFSASSVRRPLPPSSLVRTSLGPPVAGIWKDGGDIFSGCHVGHIKYYKCAGVPQMPIKPMLCEVKKIKKKLIFEKN